MQTSEGVSSAPLPPPESLFGPPPPLETTTGGSPGPQDPIGGSSNLLAPVSSSTMSYVNHSHATYYPTDLYSGYPVASVFSAAGAQKTALQPTRQRTKARSNAGNLRPDLLLLLLLHQVVGLTQLWWRAFHLPILALIWSLWSLWSSLIGSQA